APVCARATSTMSPLPGKARIIRAGSSSHRPVPAEIDPHKARETRYHGGHRTAALYSDPGSRAYRDFQRFISTQFEKKLVTMVDWSDDRIAALSDQDLKNLLVNAERKSVASVIEQCKAEIEKRDALK